MCVWRYVEVADTTTGSNDKARRDTRKFESRRREFLVDTQKR